MFRLIEAILSPDAAERQRAWLDGFLVADGAAFERAIGTADVVVCEQQPVDAAVLERAERLRLVQKFGTDLRTIDVAAAADRGILVATWRRGGNRRVADHA